MAYLTARGNLYSDGTSKLCVHDGDARHQSHASGHCRYLYTGERVSQRGEKVILKGGVSIYKGGHSSIVIIYGFALGLSTPLALE